MIATEQWEREAIKTKLLNLGKISQIARLNTYLITCKNRKKVLGLKPQGPGTPTCPADDRQMITTRQFVGHYLLYPRISILLFISLTLATVSHR